MIYYTMIHMMSGHCIRLWFTYRYIRWTKQMAMASIFVAFWWGFIIVNPLSYYIWVKFAVWCMQFNKNKMEYALCNSISILTNFIVYETHMNTTHYSLFIEYKIDGHEMLSWIERIKTPTDTYNSLFNRFRTILLLSIYLGYFSISL